MTQARTDVTDTADAGETAFAAHMRRHGFAVDGFGGWTVADFHDQWDGTVDGIPVEVKTVHRDGRIDLVFVEEHALVRYIEQAPPDLLLAFMRDGAILGLISAFDAVQSAVGPFEATSRPGLGGSRYWSVPLENLRPCAACNAQR